MFEMIMGWIEAFSASAEVFLNLLELLALGVSVATFFFFMLNQYSKALKVILVPCGMNLRSRIRVLFLCRKSPAKKRAFIEYAILKTQGSATVASDWQIIVNEFKAYFSESQSNLVYTIPNCTLLIGEDFSDAAGRYFSFFSTPKAKNVFGIRDEQIGWVIKLHVEEAYTTPTCLLTGLLSQYEENWSEFIKRYVSTAYITESDENIANDILSNELYFTFAWLLWGPSYELDYKTYWAGLCQISYGDESNSVPAIANIKNNVGGRLAERFSEARDRRYGVLLSADISLFENKAYYEKLRDNVNPDNLYFYDKIEKGSLSFAVQIDDFLPCESYKAKKYYCTAYVWLLFELEDSENFSFRPEKSVAFFEHANLTDKKTYHFLIETLIDKSIKHFETIFENPKYAGRQYRFVCAMNNEIEAAFLARFAERMEREDDFKNRILLEPKHSPTEAFVAFDEYFAQSKFLTFQEVSLRDKASVSDLGQFYTDVYMECFPDVDERETFDNLLTYLKNAETATDYKYHIILAKDENGSVVGGGIFDYFKRTNAGMIEFIAVRGDSQSSGIGSIIYKHILSVFAKDAYENGKQKLSYVFCEIDSPQHSKANIKKYLYFWNKHNYKHLDFTYVQPSLSPSQSPVTGLWLTAAPQSGVCGSLDGKLVADVIYDYMKYAMQIDRPESDPIYLKMHEELVCRKEIGMMRIVE